MKVLKLALCCGFLLGLSGCESGRYVPVSGVVTLNGTPLVGAMVLFQPTGGNDTGGYGSFARTDSEGRFSLEVAAPKPIPGAKVGKHRVTIGMPEKAQNTTSDAMVKTKVKFKDPVPERYNTKSELDFEVTGKGTDQANFALTSP